MGSAAKTEKRLRRYLREYEPEYFVVSQEWWRAEEAAGLRSSVTEDFSRTSQGPRYVVFAAKESRSPATRRPD